MEITRPLPVGLKYHCFLSYKQSPSATDLVRTQYQILTRRGFKCWHDMHFEGDLTLEAMLKGVRESLVYCLHLSKNVFPSKYVEQELTLAVKLNKPIMLLSHPDTGANKYWSFEDYISKAPEVLKPYFDTVESIQLHRKSKHEEVATREIEARLTFFLRQALKKEIFINRSIHKIGKARQFCIAERDYEDHLAWSMAYVLLMTYAVLNTFLDMVKFFMNKLKWPSI